MPIGSCVIRPKDPRRAKTGGQSNRIDPEGFYTPIRISRTCGSCRRARSARRLKEENLFGQQLRAPTLHGYMVRHLYTHTHTHTHIYKPQQKPERVEVRQVRR